MRRFARNLLSDVRGATAIEYGLIIGVLGLAVAFAGNALVLALLDVVNDLANTA